MAELQWLGVVRHGESIGNVAASAAEEAGIELIDIAERDADVPLSETGREQAAAVGAYFGKWADDERPELAVVSPYLRTRQTAEIATADLGIRLVQDERLRDRELGVLDLLTTHGLRKRFPDEEARRKRLGRFYYRPPGGESWADVTLRLRSLLGDLRRDYDGGRVVLFAHEAVVYLLRYLVEELTEPEVTGLVRANLIGNCSITTWQQDADGRLELVEFNRIEHLKREGAEPTAEEEVDAEPV